MERDRVYHRTESKDDVTPTLAAGWSVIELAKQFAKLRLIWMESGYSLAGQTVENAKFLFAETLIETYRSVWRTTAMAAKEISGLARARVWRRQNNFRPLAGRMPRKPLTQGLRLLTSQVAERHISIAGGKENARILRKVGSVSRNIPGALTVANQGESSGPMK
jgi:hypothetical protein